jgi:hypothetical protein
MGRCNGVWTVCDLTITLPSALLDWWCYGQVTQ